MFKFLMEEQNDGSGGSGSGGGAPAPQNIGDGNGGAGAGGQPVGNGGGGGGQSGGDAKSWLETLPDDIKADPSLQMFKDPASLAKSYVNAQKMIGADKVILPTDKSTEEEWANFFNKVGRPESADKYEIKLPNGQHLDEGFAKQFKEAAFKSGLSAKQVNHLAEWYAGAAKQTLEAAEGKKISELRDSLHNYTQKLGGQEKYMARVEDARVAVRSLASPELQEYFKKSGVGSQPEMIEFFANLKGMMSEDKIRDGSGVPFNVEDPAEIQREITALEEKMFGNLNSSSKDEWMKQRDSLYTRLENARKKPA